MGEEEGDVALEENLMELSGIGKTVDGAGIAYFQLDCVGKKVTTIGLVEQYIYLRQIDLSQNRIQDVAPLSTLEFVLKLSLAGNEIESIDAWGPGQFQHLMHLDLSSNKLKALPKLHMPALRTASFAQNEIATCLDFLGHDCLQRLDLSQNSIGTLEGVRDLPKLTSLNASSNQLLGTGGLVGLPVLEVLLLAKNNLENLNGPWSGVSQVKELDVSGNAIKDREGLLMLCELVKLQRIQMAENPMGEEEDVNMRLEALICHDKIQVIDGEEVTEEEIDEAKQLKEKRQEEERERQREEEERERQRQEEGEDGAEEGAEGDEGEG